MKSHVFAASLLLLAFLPVRGADSERLKLAEEFLVVTRVEQSFRGGWTSHPGGDSPAPAPLPKSVWLLLKPEYVRVHAEIYSTEELRGLIAFYKSPLGQSYLDRNAQLAAKLLQASEKALSAPAPPR